MATVPGCTDVPPVYTGTKDVPPVYTGTRDVNCKCTGDFLLDYTHTNVVLPYYCPCMRVVPVVFMGIRAFRRCFWYDIVSVYHEGFVYLFGGEWTNDRKLLDDKDLYRRCDELWRYDLETDDFDRLKVKGTIRNRYGCSASLYKKNYWLIYTDYGELFYIKLNPSSQQDLKYVPIHRKGPIFRKHESFVRGNYFFVVGTLEKTKKTKNELTVYTYSILEKKWRYFRTNPKFGQRFGFKISVIDNKLYIVGGTPMDNFEILDRIRCIDLDSGNTTTLFAVGQDVNEFAEPRHHHSIVTLPNANKFIIFGGIDNFMVEYFSSSWEFDLKSLKWKKCNNLELTQEVHRHDTVLLPDRRVIVVGGLDEQHRLRVTIQFGTIEN